VERLHEVVPGGRGVARREALDGRAAFGNELVDGGPDVLGANVGESRESGKIEKRIHGSVALENGASAHQRALHAAGELESLEGRVLALARERLGAHDPGRRGIEEADVGAAPRGETPGRDSEDARRAM